MKIIKIITIFSLLLMCSACVSFPNTAAFDLPQGAKVGYDISLSEEIAHTHYGTTVFNNIKKPYPDLNWELNEHAKSETIRLLKSYDFEPVEIGEIMSVEDQKKLKELEGSLLNDETSVVFKEFEQKRIDILKNKYGVAALVTMKSFPGVVSSECGNFGCTDFTAEHPGFYTRGLALLPPFLHAVLPSYTSAMVLEPIAPIQNYGGPYAQITPQLLHMKSFKPSNFKAMTESEWGQVKEKLHALITRNLENYVKALKAGADGNGGFVRDVK